MTTAAAATLSTKPIEFAYVATHIGVHPWVFPTNPTQTVFAFPASNTRQIVILNTGGNPLLFGFQVFNSEADLLSSALVGAAAPYAFNVAFFPTASSAALVLNEGNNCARLPVGASISIDLGSYEQRGSFNPIPGTNPLGFISYPCSLLFFGAVGGDTTADITYVNTFGTF
jgi:hypothetical protein